MKTIAGYTECPDCPTWSIAVLKNGRIRRHEPGMESVTTKAWNARRGFKQTICPGSGKKVWDPKQNYARILPVEPSYLDKVAKARSG